MERIGVPLDSVPEQFRSSILEIQDRRNKEDARRNLFEVSAKEDEIRRREMLLQQKELALSRQRLKNKEKKRALLKQEIDRVWEEELRRRGEEDQRRRLEDERRAVEDERRRAHDAQRLHAMRSYEALLGKTGYVTLQQELTSQAFSDSHQEDQGELESHLLLGEIEKREREKERVENENTRRELENILISEGRYQMLAQMDWEANGANGSKNNSNSANSHASNSIFNEANLGNTTSSHPQPAQASHQQPHPLPQQQPQSPPVVVNPLSNFVSDNASPLALPVHAIASAANVIVNALMPSNSGAGTQSQPAWSSPQQHGQQPSVPHAIQQPQQPTFLQSPSTMQQPHLVQPMQPLQMGQQQQQFPATLLEQLQHQKEQIQPSSFPGSLAKNASQPQTQHPVPTMYNAVTLLEQDLPDCFDFMLFDNNQVNFDEYQKKKRDQKATLQQQQQPHPTTQTASDDGAIFYSLVPVAGNRKFPSSASAAAKGNENPASVSSNPNHVIATASLSHSGGHERPFSGHQQQQPAASHNNAMPPLVQSPMQQQQQAIYPHHGPNSPRENLNSNPGLFGLLIPNSPSSPFAHNQQQVASSNLPPTYQSFMSSRESNSSHESPCNTSYGSQHSGDIGPSPSFLNSLISNSIESNHFAPQQHVNPFGAQPNQSQQQPQGLSFSGSFNPMSSNNSNAMSPFTSSDPQQHYAPQQIYSSHSSLSESEDILPTDAPPPYPATSNLLSIFPSAPNHSTLAVPIASNPAFGASGGNDAMSGSVSFSHSVSPPQHLINSNPALLPTHNPTQPHSAFTGSNPNSAPLYQQQFPPQHTQQPLLHQHNAMNSIGELTQLIPSSHQQLPLQQANLMPHSNHNLVSSPQTQSPLLSFVSSPVSPTAAANNLIASSLIATPPVTPHANAISSPFANSPSVSLSRESSQHLQQLPQQQNSFVQNVMNVNAVHSPSNRTTHYNPFGSGSNEAEFANNQQQHHQANVYSTSTLASNNIVPQSPPVQPVHVDPSHVESCLDEFELMDIPRQSQQQPNANVRQPLIEQGTSAQAMANHQAHVLAQPRPTSQGDHAIGVVTGVISSAGQFLMENFVGGASSVTASLLPSTSMSAGNAASNVASNLNSQQQANAASIVRERSGNDQSLPILNTQKPGSNPPSRPTSNSYAPSNVANSSSDDGHYMIRTNVSSNTTAGQNSNPLSAKSRTSNNNSNSSGSLATSADEWLLMEDFVLDDVSREEYRQKTNTALDKLSSLTSVLHSAEKQFPKIIQEDGVILSKTQQYKDARKTKVAAAEKAVYEYIQRILPHVEKCVQSSDTFNPIDSLSDTFGFNAITWSDRDCWKNCAGCKNYFTKGGLQLVCKLCQLTYCEKCNLKKVEFDPSILGINKQTKPGQEQFHVKGCSHCYKAIEKFKRKLNFEKNVQSSKDVLAPVVELYTESLTVKTAIEKQMASIRSILYQQGSHDETTAVAISKLESMRIFTDQYYALINRVASHIANNAKKSTSKEKLATPNSITLLNHLKSSMTSYLEKTKIAIENLKLEAISEKAEIQHTNSKK